MSITALIRSALAVIILAALNMLGAADADSMLQAMAKDVQAMQAQREAAVKALPQLRAEAIDLQLEGAVHWRDRWGNAKQGSLKVPLHRSGQTLIGDWAGCRDHQPHRHLVDASGLTMGKKNLNGTLIIHSNDLRPARIDIAITATADKGVISGKWTISNGTGAIRSGSGSISGSSKSLTAQLALPAEPKDDLDAPEHLTQYQRGQWLEHCSQLLYRDLHAAALAKNQALAFAVAQQRISVNRPQYKDIGTVDKSGRVKKKKGKSKKPKRPSLRDALGDVSDGLGEDLMGDTSNTAKRHAANQGLSQVVTTYIAAMQPRIAKRKELASKPRPGKAVRGSMKQSDPNFGPFYGNQPLPRSGKNINHIPAQRPPQGAPAWPYITGWIVCGPIPSVARLNDDAGWPELVPILDHPMPIDEKRYPAKKLKKAPEPMTGPGAIETGTGKVRSPPWSVWEDHGWHRFSFPHGSIFATTTVHMESAGEVWLGITADDHGKLWINDSLAWASESYPNLRSNERTALVKVSLQSGANTMLFRLDNERDDASFSVRVCVSGSPGQNIIDHTIADTRPSSRGWRYDGSGVWPETTPPLAWDPFNNINVRWRIPLKPGHATPVILGDKLFVMQESHDLFCFDKHSGKQLWRKAIDIVETKSESLKNEAAEVRKQVAAAEVELAKLGKDKASRLATLKAQGLDDKAAADKLKGLTRQANAYEGFLQSKCGVAKAGWGNLTGHTYATPVTDGKRLWVKINTGALACVDTDGNIKWLIDHEGTTSNCSQCSSPVLDGNRLIIHVPRKDDPNRKGLQTGGNMLKAYDADTGAKLWEAPTAGIGWVTGSPVLMYLGNGAQRTGVVISADGTAVRSTDGTIIREFLGAREVYGTPLRVGDQIFFGPNRRKVGYRFLFHNPDTIGVKTLWDMNHLGYFQDGNYGVYHQGQLFYSRPLVDVSDAKSGALQWTSGNPFWTKQGRGYPPISLAGGHLYVADNATWFQPTNRPNTSAFPGAMSVLTPKTPGIVLARNHIERLHGGPAFDGDRLYVRSMFSLMCFAHTGEAGKRFEAETVAREVLSAVYPDPPSTKAVTAITAKPRPAKSRFRASSGPGISLNWLATSAMDEAQAIALAKGQAFADLKLYDHKSQIASVQEQGHSYPIRSLHGRNMREWASDGPFDLSKFHGGHFKHIGLSALMGNQIALQKLIPESRPQGQAVVLATLIVNSKARTLRWDAAGSQQAFIGGQPLSHNSCIELSAGIIPVTVVVPFNGKNVQEVRPRFWPSQGPAKDLTAWKTHIGHVAPYLQRAVNLAGDSDLGAKAKVALATQ